MIFDRGKKKWTSLMLVEHVEALESLWTEFDREEKPSLDEQAILDIERTILHVYQLQKSVELLVYEDGFLIEKIGYITNVNSANQSVHLDRQLILFRNILDAKIYE